MNIYDKIYLLGKSLPENGTLELDPSDLFVAQNRHDRGGSEEVFSNALGWAIQNGLVTISPTKNKVVIKQHSLVRSDDLQKTLGIDRFRFRRVRKSAKAESLFTDPHGKNYYTVPAAKQIMQKQLLG